MRNRGSGAVLAKVLWVGIHFGASGSHAGLEMSCIVRKPDYRILDNKDAEQSCSAYEK